MSVAICEARIRVIYNNDAPTKPRVRILIGEWDIYDGPPLPEEWIKDIIKPMFQAIKLVELRAEKVAWNIQHSQPWPCRPADESEKEDK